jgi:hypothetical protein
MPSKKNIIDVVAVLAVTMWLSAVVLGTPWCIVDNPANSNPEAAWSNTAGGSSDILYSYLNGASWTEEVAVADDGANGVSPAIVIDGSGNRTIAWETSDSPARIELSSKPYSGGSWSSPVIVSDTDESSRAPSTAIFNGDAYIAYEVVPSSGGRLVKVARDDGQGNYPRTTVRTTSSTNPLDSRIHSESGHLWVEWIDEAGVLGWSEYVHDEWTAMDTQSFESEKDLNLAHDLVRVTVLGL